jgi:hypothetical protein
MPPYIHQAVTRSVSGWQWNGGDYPNGVTLSFWIVSRCLDHGAATRPTPKTIGKSNHSSYRCGDPSRSANGISVAESTAQTPDLGGTGRSSSSVCGPI